jgi:hypothetical protein
MNSKCNSPKFIAVFINVYKQHICPWKVKDKSYSNRDVKKKACDQLLNYYKQYAPSATEDLHNKIKRAQVIPLESPMLAKCTSNSGVNSLTARI